MTRETPWTDAAGTGSGRSISRTGVGDVGAGETSVVVAVASAHRKDAQDACAEAMEALKARVPIWKKEIFEGASAEGVWKANGLGAFAASEAAS